jgi:prophage regulatory protein
VERHEIRLMGTSEVAERLGVTPARVNQLADSRRQEFPEPIAWLSMGRVWLTQDIEAWIRGHRPELAGETETD